MKLTPRQYVYITVEDQLYVVRYTADISSRIHNKFYPHVRAWWPVASVLRARTIKELINSNHDLIGEVMAHFTNGSERFNLGIHRFILASRAVARSLNNTESLLSNQPS